jgi:PmbA protein
MKQLLETVIGKLVDAKAEADVIYSAGRSLKLSSQKGSIAEYNVTSSRILGVRAIKDGRVGIAFSEALDEESLDLMVTQALANADHSEENPYERILDLAGELRDDLSYPEPAVPIEEKIRRALTLETAVRAADARVTAVPYTSFSEGEHESAYLSSRGRFTASADKVYSITSSAVMEEDGRKSSYYDFDITHTFAELRWEKVVGTALEHATNLLAETPLPTGKYSVVFTTDCLKSLFECFGNFTSAKAAADKLNPWSEKLGQTVASSDLTLADEPQYTGAFRRSLFDAEGVAQKRLVLLQDGVLSNLYHNSVTARKFNTHTTGHAARSAAGSIGVAGTHLVLTGKNPKLRPTRYLEVIQMDGLYSGANRVTGNFSVAVKGYLWENGERKLTVGRCTLSGNFPELLARAEVTGVAVDAATDRSFFSVPLVFPDLSIAGV